MDARSGADRHQGEGAADTSVDGRSIWTLRDIAAKPLAGGDAGAGPGIDPDGRGAAEDLFFPRGGAIG